MTQDFLTISTLAMFIITWLLVLALVLSIFGVNKLESCNYNCAQGRNCRCGGDDE